MLQGELKSEIIYDKIKEGDFKVVEYLKNGKIQSTKLMSKQGNGESTLYYEDGTKSTSC
jgi:antitoxin component YwqK of YwqJK toxin-antitoxin module